METNMAKPKLINNDREAYESYPTVDTEIALIKHDIKSIRDETNIHNKQTEKDFASIHKKIDKIDNRLWWLAGIIIAATVGPLIAGLFT